MMGAVKCISGFQNRAILGILSRNFGVYSLGKYQSFTNNFRVFLVMLCNPPAPVHPVPAGFTWNFSKHRKNKEATTPEKYASKPFIDNCSTWVPSPRTRISEWSWAVWWSSPPMPVEHGRQLVTSPQPCFTLVDRLVVVGDFGWGAWGFWVFGWEKWGRDCGMFFLCFCFGVYKFGLGRESFL